MNARRFTGLVQESAGVDEGRARRAIAATLATLGERITLGEARDLATELPPEVAPWLGADGAPEPFDVDEFVRRVAEREGVDASTAERDARAVFTALGHALSADELAHVAAQLPKDFAPLLPRGADVEPMDADEFIERVARRAGLDASHAMRATDVVLEALAGRLAAGEVDDLVARLPIALHAPLRRGRAGAGGDTRRVPLARFLARAAEREGVAPAAALAHARAVMETLREAVGDAEFFDVTSQLPAEYIRTLAPGARHGRD